MADRMSIDNNDHDHSDDSMGSSPDADHGQNSAAGDHSANAANTPSTTGAQSGSAPGTAATQDAPPPKRKGGRKPIYATSEERKQRNRQAQAAFRERRTEYIKQLEETIRVHENNLHNLQTAHRSAADECLMLRYKNSLLERILLEKGIDVQAELRDKTGSPSLGPTHAPQNMVQPPPIHRSLLNRHQPRRSTSNIAPKIEPGISSLPPPIHAHGSAASPKSYTTTSTHVNSPSTTSTGYGGQMAPPTLAPDPTGIRPTMAMKPLAPVTQAPKRPMAQPAPPGPGYRMGAAPPAASGPPNSAGPFYPTPSFQNHIDQLEQEYDAQADIIEEPEPDTPGPGPYPSNYVASPQQMAVSPASTGPPVGQHQQPGQQLPSIGQQQQQQGQYPSMTQLLDPSMDWDPFGLSASMQFPTQFNFDTSNMR